MRNVVLGIVFDCFYEPGGEAEAEAEGFQAEMQNLLIITPPERKRMPRRAH